MKPSPLVIAPQPTAVYPSPEIVSVTPQLAEAWLGKNTHNRNVRPRVVDAYARDMARGDWKLNGEAIKFGADGVLLDGQHRLHAIVRAGVTVPVLVVTGLPSDTQTTMDTGAKRTAADALSLIGEAHSKTLAGGARRALIWDRLDRKGYITQGTAATNAELLATIERYPDLRASAEYADSQRKYVPLAAAPLCFCHWALSGIALDHADAFFDALGSGANLGRRNPVLVLRQRLIENATSPNKTPENILVAWMFKAWNASRAGKEINLIRYSPNAGEEYPIPH